MHVGANVKSLATNNTEIDLRRSDPIDRITINVDQARLALDHFSLARQLVERNAAMFFGRNHWRHLVKIAAKFLERSTDSIFIERRDRSLIDYFALSVLRARSHSKGKCADIFLVFAHQQILHFGPATDRDEKQSGRNRIECAAMTDLLDPSWRLTTATTSCDVISSALSTSKTPSGVARLRASRTVSRITLCSTSANDPRTRAPAASGVSSAAKLLANCADIDPGALRAHADTHFAVS